MTPFPTVFGYDQSRMATATNNLGGLRQGLVSPDSLTDAAGGGPRLHGEPGRQPALVDFVGTLNNGDRAVRHWPAAAAPRPPTPAGTCWATPIPRPSTGALVAPADRPNLDAAIYVFESTTGHTGAATAATSTAWAATRVLPAGPGLLRARERGPDQRLR